MFGSYLSMAVAGAALASSTVTSEFPLEERALEKATSALFEAVEDPRGPHAFFTEAYAANIPLDAWNDEQLAALVEQGPLNNLTAYRITWYPVDTLMGAVDFVGLDEGGEDLVCGYVLWEFSAGSEASLRWYEATHVDVDALKNMSDEEAATRLLEANCAFTSLEANFALSKN